MKFIDYDVESLYKEVRERAEEEGAYEIEAWKSIVEDVLEKHEEFGELDEQELVQIKEELVGRFADFESEERGEV